MEETNLKAWLDSQVESYRRHLPLVQEYAQLLRDILSRACPRLAPAALVQARAKAIPSFAQKILRKRDKYADPVKQLTDLVGARVIVQTLDEVQKVSRFIADHFEIDQANSLDAAERLGAGEFGYRSVHVVVQWQRGSFPSADIPLAVPEKLLPHAEDKVSKKAEIQVRTLAQHVWADIGHDRLYKSPFNIPEAWSREAARAAAMLENVDQTFTHLAERVDDYRLHYDAYLSPEKMRRERDLLELVLQHDPGNAELLRHIVRLGLCLEDWEGVVRFLERQPAPLSSALKACLGQALCRLGTAAGRSQELSRGQQKLQEVTQSDPGHVEALLHLADASADSDEAKALALYLQAFQRDPTHPAALGNYLVGRIAQDQSLAAVALVRSALVDAIERCTHQTEVGVHLPEALYWKSLFQVLLGQERDALPSALKAIERTAGPGPLQSSLRLTERLRPVRPLLPALDWLERLLLIAGTVKFPAAGFRMALQKLVSKPTFALSPPVVILAGGCDATYQDRMESYRTLLREAFRNVQGTVIGGGTSQGISGLTGELAKIYPGRIRLVAYVPDKLPADATLDERYSIRRMPGTGFSPQEPLQNWIDLLASGIPAEDVVLVGINGGPIAELEYRLAWTLGARVGVLRESGRAAGEVTREVESGALPGLALLPADLTTLAEFLRGPERVPAWRDDLARAIHNEYRRNQAQRFQGQDAAMQDWDRLPPHLRLSNLKQADHVLAKLAAVGLEAMPASGQEIQPFEFSAEQVEMLAEIEHARWNVERLLAGWTLGPRDPARKQSPYLVSWQDLPEEAKEWDRQTVRAIPQFLAGVGLAIHGLQ